MGAICDDCKQDMLEVDGCIFPEVRIGRKWYKRSLEHWQDSGRCHDCGAMMGKVHHYGCDQERCPKCGGQFMGCPCISGKILFRKPEIIVKGKR